MQSSEREQALNILKSISDCNEDPLSKQGKRFEASYGYYAQIINSEFSDWLKNELGVSFASDRRKQGEESYGSLEEHMKAAGMMSIDEMMAASRLGGFAVNASVTDLGSFKQWLEVRYRESLSLHTRLELEKRHDDELYEWALAHKAVFAEVYANLSKAMSPEEDKALSPIKRIH